MHGLYWLLSGVSSSEGSGAEQMGDPIKKYPSVNAEHSNRSLERGVNVCEFTIAST